MALHFIVLRRRTCRLLMALHFIVLRRRTCGLLMAHFHTELGASICYEKI